MRIPFPERIPLSNAIPFAFVILLGLMGNGTNLMFAALAFLFIVLSTVTFNMAGGFTRSTGAYVFFFAVLVAILGLVVKVVIWEPADSKLHSPTTTMAAYTGGIAAMMGAVFFSRMVARKEGFLQNICAVEKLGQAAIGCLIVGTVIPSLAAIVIASQNAVLLPIATASSQLNRFLPMAMILGTTYEIRMSGGKRNYNLTVILAACVIIFNGFVISFSKESLFTPPLCWVISCGVLRYNFSRFQIRGLVAVIAFSLYFLVPYSQYGRTFRDATLPLNQQFAISMSLLSDLGDVRQKYYAQESGVVREENGSWFFDRPMGLFDRLQMFSVDDAFITVTDQKGEFGLSPYILYAGNVVPRIFWKDKPTVGIGNTFAHEIGFNPEDDTTGISLSPISESYHEARWFGVLIVSPIVWFMLFTIGDSLCGDLRKSPWGLLMFALYAHEAPEGGMQGATYLMTYGVIITITVAFFSAYIMPLIGVLVTPPRRRTLAMVPLRKLEGRVFPNPEPEPSEP